MPLRVGSLVFSTDQGLGYLAKAFYDNGIVTDVMTIAHGKRQEHPEWYPKAGHITSLHHPDQIDRIKEFCNSMDVMLFFETPFNWDLLSWCHRVGTKTVLMPMHECMPKEAPYQFVDLFLCPSLLDLKCFPGSTIYEGETGPGEQVVDLKKTSVTDSIFLPIPVQVPWRQRTKVETFVHNAGHGGLKGRNGTAELLQALRLVKERKAKFIIRSQEQQNWPPYPELLGLDISLRIGTHPAETLWNEGDCFVFPERFNGLSLPLQEARAAGMLVMCGDRFPMNTWLPTKVPTETKSADFSKSPPDPPEGDLFNPLIPVSKFRRNSVSPRCVEFDEAVFGPKAIAAKIDEWYGRDITKYSIEGKSWAEENSWEKLKPRYMEVLEGLLNG